MDKKLTLDDIMALVKWISTARKHCYVCNGVRNHEFGISYEGKEEKHIQRCQGCKTVTEKPE